MSESSWSGAFRPVLVVLGAAFLAAYSVLALWYPRPASVTVVAVSVLAVAWLAFLLDYAVRLALTARGERGHFVAHNIVALLSIALPPVRAARVVQLLVKLPSFQHSVGARVRTRILGSAIAYSIVFVYMSSLAALVAERDAPGATITTFGDAIWWAIVTIATVGYVDVYPVTPLGRIYGAALMAGGFAMLGVASATIVSYISEKTRAESTR